MELQLTYAFGRDEVYVEVITVEEESICCDVFGLVEKHIDRNHGEGAMGRVIAISLLKREVESDGEEEN